MSESLVKYEAIVVGASTGGIWALLQALSHLPKKFPMPIAIVLHLPPENQGNFMLEYLNENCEMDVKQADEKETLEAGKMYLAPPNYHLLVEKDKSISLSVDKKVNYCRPAVDVLFETAAEAFGETLVGVILTGANNDGAKGLAAVQARGGLTIVQKPEEAKAPEMPEAAIKLCSVDYILPLTKISELLIELGS